MSKGTLIVMVVVVMMQDRRMMTKMVMELIGEDKDETRTHQLDSMKQRAPALAKEAETTSACSGATCGTV